MRNPSLRVTNANRASAVPMARQLPKISFIE
jgi:hypothetical protein